MKVIDQSVSMVDTVRGNAILRKIEIAARNCYKSEDNNENWDTEKTNTFVAGVIRRGHHSVLEHESLTARFICNRGVTHELVRHRIGVAYSQESTRYCNYGKEKFGKEITVIRPHWWVAEHPLSDEEESAQWTWEQHMIHCEQAYFKLLNLGLKPQDARGVLPIDLKTEIVVTMNMRAWRHFFYLRTAKAAHPQIRDLARQLLIHFRGFIPVLFDDIGEVN